MSHFTKEFLENLARVSYLKLSNKEMDLFFDRLDKVLHHVETLKTINIEGVPPTISVVSNSVRSLRKDEVGSVLDRDTFLSNSSKHIGGMVSVPPVLQDND